MDKRSTYFRGVAVGLLIAWVTSALAYYVRGNSSLPPLIAFEAVVCVIMAVVALVLHARKGKGDKT